MASKQNVEVDWGILKLLRKSMFTEGNDFPVVINYRIFLIVISRLFRVVIILLTSITSTV